MTKNTAQNSILRRLLRDRQTRPAGLAMPRAGLGRRFGRRVLCAALALSLPLNSMGIAGEDLLSRRALSEVDGRDPVLAANAVRAAAERIGERIGAAYSADMLENLFSRFCVGK